MSGCTVAPGIDDEEWYAVRFSCVGSWTAPRIHVGRVTAGLFGRRGEQGEGGKIHLDLVRESMASLFAQELNRALKEIGVSEEDIDCIWAFLVSLLYLGNIDFGDDR